MSASGPSSGFAFGPFRLDPAKRLLYRNDQLLPLRPKVIDVLIMLVERRGDLVEKDELIQGIWPDAAVEESNLSTTVSALRRTLGDGYIETVPRRGYRFAASIHEPVAEGYTAKRAKRPVRFWIASATGLVAIMLVVWRLPSLRNQPAEAAWKTEPLTTLEGAEVFPAFSPDNKSVVFLWTGRSSDRGDLYVKRLGQSEITRLTNDDAIECYPAWSPDGRWIAFLHCGTGAIEGFIASTASVYVIPAGGGEKRKVGEVRSPTSLYLSQLAWTPDSQWLVVRNREPASDRLALFLLSPATGEQKQITFPPPGSDNDVAPAISPDGRFLAFARTNSWQVRQIYVVPLSRGYTPSAQPRKVTLSENDIPAVFWAENGRALLYWSRKTGIASLWRVDPARGGAPRLVPALGTTAAQVNASPDGRLLAYTDGYTDPDIWRIPMPPASTPASIRLISSTRTDVNPQFSPDGARVAFASNRTGMMEIWTALADGSNPVQLTHYGAECGSPRWSPDGTQIAFDLTVGGNPDIYVISSNGGEPRRLTEHPGSDRVPTWSRDGKWIYFTSNRTGRYEIWRVTAEGGQATEITQNGGFVAFESAEGKYLYYARRHTRPYSVYRLPLSGGEERRIIETLKGWASFALSSKGIYFVSDSAPQTLQFYDFLHERIRGVGRLDKPVGAGFAFSPDGRSILVAPAEFRNGDLFLASR